MFRLSWWSPAGTYHDVADPKINYDPYSDRWIAAVTANFLATNSYGLVAVSATGDPTGQWYYRQLRADPNGQLCVDYPQVGFNKNWIAVNFLMLKIDQSGLVSSHLYCFDKTNFYAGGTNYTMFNISTLTNNYWICPAGTYDNNISTLYCLQRWSDYYTNVVNGVSTIQGVLRLHTITGSPSSPVFTSTGNLPGADPWDSDLEAIIIGPQSGSTNKIDVGNDRVQNVVYRDGSLWTVNTVLLPAGNPTRSAIRWWQIDTGDPGKPIQTGLIDDSTGTNFFGYPSIAVNRYGDALIGFTRYSATTHPSAAYAFRGNSDPADKFRDDTVFQGGLDVYYLPDQFDRNRWGDFSSTVVDPANDYDFWTLQQYAYYRSSTNLKSGQVGVQWAQIVVQLPGNDNFSNAFELSGRNGNTNGTLFRATAEADEPAHAGASPYRSIWYKWTAPADGDVTFDTLSSPYEIDTLLAVYTGTAVSSNSLTLVAENDNLSSRAKRSQLKFTATNGVTYRIAVDGKSEPNEITDAIVLHWDQPLAPLFLIGPERTIDALAGNGVLLISLAIGYPTPTCQWRFNSNAIAGATFSTYTNSSVQLTNEGYYDCVASNSHGSATDIVSYLKVYAAPTATFTNTEAFGDRVQMLVDGINGYTYTVQGTTDFITWTNLQSGVCDFVFTNYFSTNFPMRFFRTYY